MVGFLPQRKVCRTCLGNTMILRCYLFWGSMLRKGRNPGWRVKALIWPLDCKSEISSIARKRKNQVPR